MDSLLTTLGGMRELAKQDGKDQEMALKKAIHYEDREDKKFDNSLYQIGRNVSNERTFQDKKVITTYVDKNGNNSHISILLHG